MAVLKSSELKFSNPTKFNVGGATLTATRVEIPATKEYESGTVEITPAQLGLTMIAGTNSAAYESGVGETAATTSPPALVWSTPLTEVKTTDEAAKKEVKEGYNAGVSVVSGNVVLRIYSTTKATDAEPIVEGKTATKKTFAAAQVLTVFAIGK